MATDEVPGPIPATFLLAGGSYDKPLREVRPGFLSVLSSEAEPVAKIAPPLTGVIGTSHGTGPLAFRSGQSARGPRARQSHLARTFRPRPR